MKKNIFSLLWYLSISFGLGLFALTSSAFAYADVPQTYAYRQAIDYLSQQNLMKGYADGTFHPNAKMTRAEFIKLIMAAKTALSSSSAPASADITLTQAPAKCFRDVLPTQWFAPDVCAAKAQHIIAGLNADFFHPNDALNIADASKILIQALGQETFVTATPAIATADVSSSGASTAASSSATSSQSPTGQPWYFPFLTNLADRKIIPNSVHYLNQNLTRGEVAEMLWRTLEHIQNQPSVNVSSLEKSYCQNSPENLPANLDLEKVRSTWLDWYNQVRAKQGLQPYTYNVQLERTATEWSEYSKKRGYLDHKRPGQKRYYDYARIENWFKNLGLTFVNDHAVTFTENIGWGYYRCSASDCTEQLLQAIHTTFAFFMSEKGKKYSPHYDSIVNSRFREIGIGLALDPSAQKYYLTVHYATAITSHPLPVCSRE